MPKVCDNKSVGILVWNDRDELLLIERKKYNPGFAIPAGHQDGDDPETTAKKELSEEVGLIANELQEAVKLSLPNPCKREGGSRHDWTIFEATSWSGEIKPSEEETKSYLWADKSAVARFVRYLEDFSTQKKIPLEINNLPALVAATNEDSNWQKNPGLEPPMYFLFKELGIA